MKPYSPRNFIFFLIVSLAVGLLFGYIITPTNHHKKQTPDAITHHTQIIQGKKYAYTTRIGTITLYDENHRPTATMSYTADTLDNISPSKRPITFFYNGGPGASTALLRIASFGPKRIILNNHKPASPAPYHLVDNQYSLLDKTDLVFIDMPGTGYGRFLGKSTQADFCGVDKDAQAFTSFIQHYISKNHRWNSPKFLFGESYGTTRTAVLANNLQQKGTQINGVVILSSILNYGLLDDHQGVGDWEYVLSLPSLAATTWNLHQSTYHPTSLKALLKEVKHFAMTDYLKALAKGNKLSPQTFHAIAKKLSDYLGISSSDIEQKNLRVSAKDFSFTLLKQHQELTGRYDARFTISSLGGDAPFGDTMDPTMIALKDAINATTQQYFYTHLHYSNPLPYRFNISVYDQWDFRHDEQRIVNASFDLTNAMIENPALRIFSANGYYDLATPFYATVYTLQHLTLPASLSQNITLKFYEAGHMIYLDPKSLAQLKKDLDNWYDQSLPSEKGISVRKRPLV